VRYIEFEKVVRKVASLCIAACYELPGDVLSALEDAMQKESNPAAVKILRKLIENAQQAAAEKIPLCQDTGLAVVFVEQGCEVTITADAGKTLSDAINAGVAAGYEKGYLRKSVAADPLRRKDPRQKTQDKRPDTKLPGLWSGVRGLESYNTPAIIHHTVVPGEKLKITVMAKGGGSENKSAFKMFKPTAQRSEIIEWVVDVVKQAGADACPPFVVGVGLGGDFELCCLLSKKALLRDLGWPNSDRFYARLEADLLWRINALGLGPQGLGGDTTALACMVETAPCHIASLPAAVNIECHSHRHKSAII